MSLTLGQGWQPKQGGTDLPARLDPMDELLLAVTMLREAILNQPIPTVHVEPQDLSDVIQAVQGLAGPSSQLTAQDIASAVSEVLLGAQPVEDTPEWVERLLEALEKLDFRMKGLGGSGGSGGGSVTLAPGTVVPVTGALTDVELRAADVDVADSAEREYTHVTATVTASGDTTVHTPAPGMAVRLRWIYVMTDPTSTTVPLVKVSLGAAEKYRIYGGLQKRQVTTGAADAALVVNMSTTGNVVVTAILEEI